MLGEEIKEHLGYEKNERTEEEKTNLYDLLTQTGEANLKVPRDRKGEYSPKVVEKGERKLDPEIEYKILSMYEQAHET